MLLLIAILAATDPRTLLAGTWKGESICTKVRPGCRNEIAVYHISVPDKPGVVDLVANKVIHGKEVEMGGTLEFKVNADATTLVADIDFGENHIEFAFTRSGKKLVGKLIDRTNGAVVRNMRLKKD